MTRAELRDRMTAEGWTIEALAEALGVAPNTVNRWRIGVRPVPPWLGAAMDGLARR